MISDAAWQAEASTFISADPNNEKLKQASEALFNAGGPQLPPSARSKVTSISFSGTPMRACTRGPVTWGPLHSCGTTS